MALVEGDPATVALFLSIGLKEAPAKELARNKKKSKILVDVIHEVRSCKFSSDTHSLCGACG